MHISDPLLQRALGKLNQLLHGVHRLVTGVGIDHLKIFNARKEFEGPLKQLEAGFLQSGKSVPPEIRQLRARYDEVLGNFALAQLTRRKPLVQLNKGGPYAVLGEVRTLATSFPLRHDRVVTLCAEFDLVFSRLQRELFFEGPGKN
jgi:hypothetical protein